MRPRASLCQSSRHRLLTLLFVLSLGLLCTQTASSSAAPISASLGDISDFINRTTLIGGTSLKRNYRIISQCRDHVQITLARGRYAVNAKANSASKFAVLTLESHAAGEFRIFGKASQKYMCFSRRGRLIARDNSSSNRCRFRWIEGDHYTMLQSAANKHWFVGFNSRGFSKSGHSWRRKAHAQRAQPSGRRCFQFTIQLITKDRADPREQSRLQRIAYDPLRNVDLDRMSVWSSRQQRRLRHSRTKGRKHGRKNRRSRRRRDR